jgi:hypothetical protein
MLRPYSAPDEAETKNFEMRTRDYNTLKLYHRIHARAEAQAVPQMYEGGDGETWVLVWASALHPPGVVRAWL